MSGEIASLCEHGSMACPDCDGVDDVRSVGQVIDEDSATRCRWCGCRLDTCRPLRADQRKCCPDCEHTASLSGSCDGAPADDGAT